MPGAKLETKKKGGITGPVTLVGYQIHHGIKVEDGDGSGCFNMVQIEFCHVISS